MSWHTWGDLVRPIFITYFSFNQKPANGTTVSSVLKLIIFEATGSLGLGVELQANKMLQVKRITDNLIMMRESNNFYAVRQ
jgi:hypothetical protein